MLISTGDKDMAQLVDPRISLVNTMSNTRLDRDGVKAKFDVFPEQIVDYLALVGDSSDNIPGITGVGPKTAAKWLNQYGTLDALIAHAAEIPGKVGENLRGELPALELSRKLATIDAAVTLEVAPEELLAGYAGSCAAAGAVRAARAAGARQIAGRDGAGCRGCDGCGDCDATATATATAAGAAVAGGGRAAGDRHEQPYGTELRGGGLARLVGGLDRRSSRPHRSSPSAPRPAASTTCARRLVGLAFAVAPGRCRLHPARPRLHRRAGAARPRSRCSGRSSRCSRIPRLPKLGRRLKFDAHILANHGITLRGQRYDSMLESYVLDSVATRHDMESTAARYLGTAVTRYEDLVGKGAKQITFGQVDVQRAADYAGEEAEVTLRLHHALWPRLEAAPRLESLYDTIEQPLSPVLYRMERTGVLVDRALLRAQSSELAARMAQLQTQAHAAAGGAFNLDSPKQLQEILFGKLGLPVARKTPTGQPSTAEDVLEELAQSYELPKLILEYRGVSKLKSTYTDKLPEQINERTGRIHTSYQQTVAATGRLSSSDPNLQNIPIRTAEGRRIRQAFIALKAIRSSPRIIRRSSCASWRTSRAMRACSKAFAEDRDIHQATAAEVLGLPAGDVSADQRRSAKAVNFGLIYGMSAFGLARQLGISRGDAQRYVDLYFERYPGVKRYMDETRAQARELGYVETVFGRRLYLPEIRSRNAAMRQYAERSAINAPMQGTAADIIKRAMIEVDAWLEKSRVPARLIMQVHDELVLEVADAAVEDTAARLREHMIAAAELAVPLKVDVGVGRNWDEAH